ncbi:MAG: hypothetical protein CL596_04035 [Alteromonas sp.]|nr:hypothetical protein [Alteromonas sp.]MAY21893.1 hypothetical protein [Flavobacteriaceae bacterium]|tara:strand:+ start:62 stop:496 length:435 start_codon:yes stop_codon:yes gene_type:complete
MGLHKILKIVALILGVVGIVFWFLILSKGDDAIEATGEGVDPMLYIAYITLGIVLLFVLIFVLKGIFSGDLKKTLMSVGAFLVVVVIGYVMSSGSIEGLPLVDGAPVTESTSKWVGAGLNTFYILALLAILAMIFSGFKKITSK